MAFSDPGLGDRSAPIGSEEWAKRWRLDMQSAVAGASSDVEHVAAMIDIGIKHRAWTVLNKSDGSLFKQFDEFVEYRKPWGLSQDPDKFRKMLEVEMGKKAVQLETVSEPGNKWEAPVSIPNGYDLSKNTKSNLRAINRAPRIVADLYRKGLINQVDAARLGKKVGVDHGEVAAELARVAEDTKELPPKERKRVINETAQRVGNGKKKTPAEHAIYWIRKCSAEELKKVTTFLGSSVISARGYQKVGT